MEEFIDLANILLSRCKVDSYLYLTKRGQLRCYDVHEGRASKGYGKTVIGVEAIAWLSNTIQLGEDEIYPKTTKVEMERFIKLRDQAIDLLLSEKKGIFYLKVVREVGRGGFIFDNNKMYIWGDTNQMGQAPLCNYNDDSDDDSDDILRMITAIYTGYDVHGVVVRKRRGKRK